MNVLGKEKFKLKKGNISFKKKIKGRNVGIGRKYQEWMFYLNNEK